LIGNPLTVSGKARGYWFFEADFPVFLYDSEGNELVVAIARAQDEWMSEDFVEFRAILEFEPVGGVGELIFKKDNPSDLPENSDQLIVPIRFE